MSTLSSASTDAQVLAEFDDTASYAEDASVAKARRFVTACRIMLRRLPKMAGQGGSSVTLNMTEIRDEMRAAQAYVAANDTGGGGRLLSFEDYR